MARSYNSASYVPGQYVVSRTIFGVLEFVGWCVLLLGIFATIGGIASAEAFFGFGVSSGKAFVIRVMCAVPGALVFLLGLIAVTYVQTCKATVDTAGLTGQLFELGKEQIVAIEQLGRMAQQATQATPLNPLEEKAATSEAHTNAGSFITPDEPAPREDAKASADTQGATIHTEDGIPLKSQRTINGKDVRYNSGHNVYMVDGKRFDNLDAVKQYCTSTAS